MEFKFCIDHPISEPRQMKKKSILRQISGDYFRYFKGRYRKIECFHCSLINLLSHIILFKEDKIIQRFLNEYHGEDQFKRHVLLIALINILDDEIPPATKELVKADITDYLFKRTLIHPSLIINHSYSAFEYSFSYPSLIFFLSCLRYMHPKPSIYYKFDSYLLGGGSPCRAPFFPHCFDITVYNAHRCVDFFPYNNILFWPLVCKDGEARQVQKTVLFSIRILQLHLCILMGSKACKLIDNVDASKISSECYNILNAFNAQHRHSSLLSLARNVLLRSFAYERLQKYIETLGINRYVKERILLQNIDILDEAGELQMTSFRKHYGEDTNLLLKDPMFECLCCNRYIRSVVYHN